MNARLEAAARALYEHDFEDVLTDVPPWQALDIVQRKAYTASAFAALAAADAHDTTEWRIADALGGGTTTEIHDPQPLVSVVKFWDSQYPARAPHRIEGRRRGPWEPYEANE